MNRRGFLKFLAAVPLIRHIPLPAKLYGDGLTSNTTISPALWKKYSEFPAGGGGGGGGAGGLVFVIMPASDSEPLRVTANGGKQLS